MRGAGSGAVRYGARRARHRQRHSPLPVSYTHLDVYTRQVYRNAPQEILHSWVEVFLDERWYELEGFILDKSYLGSLQAAHPECAGAFCGYGVAVKDFKRPPIDFDCNDTYIQSEGITRDLGIYDCPDDLLQEHGQAMPAIKAFVYRYPVSYTHLDVYKRQPWHCMRLGLRWFLVLPPPEQPSTSTLLLRPVSHESVLAVWFLVSKS